MKSKDGDRGDEETFDRTVEVRRRANERLGLDEPCRTLVAPKLRAKSQGISANLSGEEVFRVRAVSSQSLARDRFGSTQAPRPSHH